MSFSLEAHVLVEGNMFDNSSSRLCKEPDHFDTVEGVQASYCKNIPDAPARSALENGESDRRAYEATRDTYHYTHEVKAFLLLKDNLYFGDAKAVLEDYRPEQVPNPPYCYSYDRPSQALEDEVRRLAGNTRTAPVASRCH